MVELITKTYRVLTIEREKNASEGLILVCPWQFEWDNDNKPLDFRAHDVWTNHVTHEGGGSDGDVKQEKREFDQKDGGTIHLGIFNKGHM